MDKSSFLRLAMSVAKTLEGSILLNDQVFSLLQSMVQCPCWLVASDLALHWSVTQGVLQCCVAAACWLLGPDGGALEAPPDLCRAQLQPATNPHLVTPRSLSRSLHIRQHPSAKAAHPLYVFFDFSARASSTARGGRSCLAGGVILSLLSVGCTRCLEGLHEQHRVPCPSAVVVALGFGGENVWAKPVLLPLAVKLTPQALLRSQGTMLKHLIPLRRSDVEADAIAFMVAAEKRLLVALQPPSGGPFEPLTLSGLGW